VSEYTLPTKDQLQKFITDAPIPVTKRDIARNFDIKGDDRKWLKAALKDLTEAGFIERTPGKSYKAPESLPAVTTIEITDISTDGELTARPTEWAGSGREPMIYVIAKSSTQIEVGERALVRLKQINKKDYEARIIHVLGGDTNNVVGVFAPVKGGGGVVHPAERSVKFDFSIDPKDVNGAKEGDLVNAEIVDTRGPAGKNRKQARIVDVLGREDDPRMISMIAVVTHGIPYEFPKEVIDQAKKGAVPPLGDRQDMRTIPLVTIDGADARDFDDAVFSEPDPDPENKGGWHIIVAIADVSSYVTPDSPLDREAYKRGNSTYFPDRVVPMLPEALSNDICSLRPDEPRACMAAHIWIDSEGQLLRYKFVRGLMQSHARLIYEQVQLARDGKPDEVTEPLMGHINNLYDTYNILLKARKDRGALDLDLPERKAVMGEDGTVKSIIPRKRLDSHQLIEEFMVLANVAAAMALEEKKAPCIYRIHDKPDSSKIDSAADFLQTFGINLAKGQVMTPKRLNQILTKAKDTEESELVSMMVLRSQSQAVYSPDNLGHFGLALDRYAHFTSPIRRYSDLLVHRSLVSAWNMPGDGALAHEDHGMLSQMAQHISDTERRSMIAERDATDRFTALYLQDRVGNSFDGHIAGVHRAGLFVKLDETGADGLIPIRTLPNDYYIHHEDHHCLVGRKTGRTYRICAPVTVRLVEADPFKGSMSFELLEYHGSPLPPAKLVQGSNSKKQEPKKRFKRKGGDKDKAKRKKTTPKHKRKAKSKPKPKGK
jgi:ribonuclease R